jgi:hypothetical protein
MAGMGSRTCISLSESIPVSPGPVTKLLDRQLNHITPISPQYAHRYK